MDDTATITVETNVPFTCHKCEPPSRSVDTTPKELMSFFTDMALMRRKEIAADSLYKSKDGSYDYEEGLHNYRLCGDRKDENVSFVMYGDGAAKQGQHFETLNMATIWDLPRLKKEVGRSWVRTHELGL
ncbi:hypothetical protein R6Q59_010292 [Mikania micrantha]